MQHSYKKPEFDADFETVEKLFLISSELFRNTFKFSFFVKKISMWNFR
jgi:hypothetical protein